MPLLLGHKLALEQKEKSQSARWGSSNMRLTEIIFLRYFG
jgi:hypothetical protein